MDKDLETFVSEVSGTSRLRVEEDFGGGFVRLQTSEAERRQALQDIRTSEDVVLELLRNAVDAHASQIFLATGNDGATRRIVVIDNGDGIPQNMQTLVFEPRVTSKLDTSHPDRWGYHGRGMALFSIKQNCREARVAKSNVDKGTAMEVIVDRSTLPEKKDQSTFPTFSMNDEGTVAVRGPKNILRTSCEFAIEEHGRANVTVGSIVEVAAALYAYGKATLSAVDRAFCSDVDDLPLCKQLACAEDPAAFASLAGTLGLELSERTARRILDGIIEPAEPLLNRITIAGAKPSSKDAGMRPALRNRVDQRGLKLGSSDIAELKRAASQAFDDIASRYYLEPSVEPTVRVTADRITISIPVVKKP